jgi:hypothetical protein
MTGWLLLSLVVSSGIGWLAVSVIWPASAHESTAHGLLRMSLGFGLGQGITSCLAFLYLVINGRASASYYVFEMLVLALLLAVFVLRVRKNTEHGRDFNAARPECSSSRTALVLGVAFYTAATTALATIALGLWDQPHGEWDAWAIWNLRARGLFRAGDAWRDIFSSVVPHPDYPLLLPLTVARGWMYGGVETTAAPAVLAWLFTASIVAAVTAAVAVLCGQAQGYIAGIALLGHIYFVLHASSQYAEIPLMFFYTSAFVLLAFHNDATDAKRRGALVLAGFAAGCAAWTKNEGLLFIVALSVAHFGIVVCSRGLRSYGSEALALVAGLLPVVAVIIYFKTQLAPPNVWIAAMNAPQVSSQLTDAGRYYVIAREIARRLFSYSGVGINMTYLLLLFVACFGITRTHRVTVAQAAVALTVMIAGFVGIYLMRNADVIAFMRGSLDRVLLQLWPVFVFAFFLLAAPVEPRMTHQQRDAHSNGAGAR